MKESRQWKDGVELFLDNRQIFLLFFASAVVLSLVFALGVVVGKRTGDKPPAQPATDPLALLDQMGGEEKQEENLTFHEVLGKEVKPAEGNDAAAAPAGEGEAKGSPEAEPAPAPAPAPARKPAQRPEKTPEPGEKQRPRQKLASGNKRQGKPAALMGKPAALVAKPAKDQGKEEAAEEEATAGNYSLQLSSFQDRTEAELFMRKLRESGVKPFLVPAKIPGRGVWYRVRIGAFKSWDEALAAKQTFERDRKIIAYVAKN